LNDDVAGFTTHNKYGCQVVGSLSKDVFEGRTSTGSEPFSLFICLDAKKFVLLNFFSLMKRIYPRVSNKPLHNNAKGPLPVDVRRSTTLLLKLPIFLWVVKRETSLFNSFYNNVAKQVARTFVVARFTAPS